MVEAEISVQFSGSNSDFNEIKNAVEKELNLFDSTFQDKTGGLPLTQYERAIIRDYLLAKIRGHF